MSFSFSTTVSMPHSRQFGMARAAMWHVPEGHLVACHQETRMDICCDASIDCRCWKVISCCRMATVFVVGRAANCNHSQHGVCVCVCVEQFARIALIKHKSHLSDCGEKSVMFQHLILVSLVRTVVISLIQNQLHQLFAVYLISLLHLMWICNAHKHETCVMQYGICA